MTNQIELHVSTLPQSIAGYVDGGGARPNKFKTVLYYGVSVNRDREQAFRQAKAFLDAYYQKDFTREASKSGPPADRSNIASTACEDLSMPGSTTSPFARSVTI